MQRSVMLVFMHRLLFVDEPSLPIPKVPANQRVTSITVKTISREPLYRPFCTIWMNLSKRQVRLCSRLPLDTLTDNDELVLEIVDVVTLYWNPRRLEIRYTKGRNYTAARLYYWILHTFMPIILEISYGYYMLHVGAIEVGNKPILFAARSYGGKSTLTDYFLHRGHTLYSDDSLGIQKTDRYYYAIPSYPYHRPFREAEELGYYIENFATTSTPIKDIYWLVKSQQDATVEISTLKGVEKFKALKATIFVNFMFLRENHFNFLAELSERVNIHAISVPWDIERLSEVYDAITRNLSDDS